MPEPVKYNPQTSPQLRETTIIGRPIERADGLLKVMGRATYAYEHAPPVKPAYGFIVEATIAAGRIVNIDVEQAERAPGVLMVMTHRNAPPQAPLGPPVADNRLARARPVLFDAKVRFRGEPIALVVAESLEAARAAAHLVTARYEETAAAVDLLRHLDCAYRPAKVGPGFETDTVVGDFEGAFAASPVQIDAIYWTAYQNHNPMEPHAALAIWDGDTLTAYVSQQNMATAKRAVAATLRMPPEKVHLISHYVGGGFGSKLPINAEVILAALAARVLHRPVKVALTRQQMFSNSGHRSGSQQRLRLGATQEGKLNALAHEVWIGTARFDEYAEQSAAPIRSLYAAPHRLTRHRAVALDLQHSESMRAPGEAPGLLACETAMDELAVKLGIDPLALRILNEPSVDPERGVPFSSRRLVECLREGAERFGWSNRPRTPRLLRESGRFIGYGMSVGIRPNRIGPSHARVRLDADGRVTAQLDLTDIGTGSYTILVQIAADTLGVQFDRVTVALGESDFPATTGSGGSLGAGSAGSALYNACLALRDKIARLAVEDSQSPLNGGDPAGAVFRDGAVQVAGHRIELAEMARRATALEAEGSVAPADAASHLSQHSYGAYFVEVEVDADTAEIRVRRMLGVFDVGRVLNERTARAQLISGMIWGVSAALHEEGVIDPRFGRFVNNDLAGYHVPVNADIGEIDAISLPGEDHLVNPLGSKGIGELGICGSGAAVGNAIFNATGVRARSFPITIGKILGGLPRARA